MTLKQRLGRWLIPRLPFNRRTFDVFRFELGCLVQRLLNTLSPGYYLRIRALKKMTGLSVNLGSGGHGLEGWINIDARSSHLDESIAFDIRRPLPLADGSVKCIFAEHVIEHLDFRDDIPGVFRDFNRVLEPGGTVRIIVPDAARFLRAYASASPAAFSGLGWDLSNLPSDIYTPMHIINHIFHQGGEHLFGWDFDTLRWALERAGFEAITRCAYTVSSDPKLAIDQPIHAPYSLYVEATKAAPRA